MRKAILGIAVVESSEHPPYGKQRFFFEDMIDAADQSPDIFFFSPLDWQEGRDTVRGYRKTDQWEEVEEALPDLIYDRSFSLKEQPHQQILRFRAFVEESGHRMLNPVKLARLLDDKLDFQRFLQAESFPTLLTWDWNEWYPEAELHRHDVTYYLKPVEGAKGDGIYKLDVKLGQATLVAGTQELSKKPWPLMYKHLPTLVGTKRYLVQQAANLKPFGNRSYDLRVIIQNGPDGLNLTGIGMRRGLPGSIVSNLHKDGDALSLKMAEEFLKKNFKLTAEDLQRKAMDLCLRCSYELEKIGGPFAEIGFDLLLLEDGNLVILEANTRPSRWMFMLMADAATTPEEAEVYRQMRAATTVAPWYYAQHFHDQTNL